MSYRFRGYVFVLDFHTQDMFEFIPPEGCPDEVMQAFLRTIAEMQQAMLRYINSGTPPPPIEEFGLEQT